MASLINKTLCIVGGSGYVGTQVAKSAISKGINVISVSRSAEVTDETLKNSKNFRAVRGDANDPESFKEALLQSDAIVHTCGTLIDTSILKGRTPGEPGTYEHMNRDLLINVAKFLEQNNKKHKIVYLSASLPPPFQPRYLSTKEEAEDYLLNSKTVSATILKPGFIYSQEQRLWSVPLSYSVDIQAKLFSCFYHNCVPENTFMKQFLKNFLVDRSVRLVDIGNSAVYSAFNQDLNGQKLFNDDIEQTSMYFSNNIQRTQAEVEANQKAAQQQEQQEKERQRKEQEAIKLAAEQQKTAELKAAQQKAQQQKQQEDQQKKQSESDN